MSFCKTAGRENVSLPLSLFNMYLNVPQIRNKHYYLVNMYMYNK